MSTGQHRRSSLPERLGSPPVLRFALDYRLEAGSRLAGSRIDVRSQQQVEPVIVRRHGQIRVEELCRAAGRHYGPGRFSEADNATELPVSSSDCA